METATSQLWDSFIDFGGAHDPARRDQAQHSDAHRYPDMNDLFPNDGFSTVEIAGAWEQQRQGGTEYLHVPGNIFGSPDADDAEPEQAGNYRLDCGVPDITPPQRSSNHASGARREKQKPRKSSEPRASFETTCIKAKGGRRTVVKRERSESPPDNRRKKFLERNRVAAGKCRQKKKEWEKNLEETMFELESRHWRLQAELKSLVEEVSLIKTRIMQHADCNHPSIDMWIKNEAMRFVHSGSHDSFEGDG